MTNVSWVVYRQDIDQLKLVILTNLFLSVQIKLLPKIIHILFIFKSTMRNVDLGLEGENSYINFQFKLFDGTGQNKFIIPEIQFFILPYFLQQIIFIVILRGRENLNNNRYPILRIKFYFISLCHFLCNGYLFHSFFIKAPLVNKRNT